MQTSPAGGSRVAKLELAIGLAIWRLRVRAGDGGEFAKLTWQQQKRNMAENWFDTMAPLPLPSPRTPAQRKPRHVATETDSFAD
jgi:hypothetical protein